MARAAARAISFRYQVPQKDKIPQSVHGPYLAPTQQISRKKKGTGSSLKTPVPGTKSIP
jgi:hypothetical protein